MEKELKKELEKYEDLIFEGHPINTKEFYNLKRKLLKGEHLDLIQIIEVLESMIEKCVVSGLSSYFLNSPAKIWPSGVLVSEISLAKSDAYFLSSIC